MQMREAVAQELESSTRRRGKAQDNASQAVLQRFETAVRLRPGSWRTTPTSKRGIQKACGARGVRIEEQETLGYSKRSRTTVNFPCFNTWQVTAMQRDSCTYCDEPEDFEDFDAWSRGFSLQARSAQRSRATPPRREYRRRASAVAQADAVLTSSPGKRAP